MAESRIIKRNVRFWGKSGLQLTGMMLIFMVVYGFLFNMGSSRVFGDFWKTAYFYGGIISVLFAMIGPVSYVGSYLPLTLSFGSGRREAVFGAQIFCVVYVVSAYIILVFAGIMSSGKFNGKLNALIAVLFIFMTAIGQLVSVAQMHFGMKGMIIGIVMVVDVYKRQMYNTYNMGIGMIVAVDPADVEKTMEAMRAAGDTPYVIGEIKDGEKGVTLC